MRGTHPRFQCYSGTDGVRWRLLGSNNRALARSAAGFTSPEEAVDDARTIGQLAADAQIDMISQAGTSWRWMMLVDGVPRAVSGTAYARRLECVRAVTRFREWAGLAPVDQTSFVGRTRAGLPRTTRLPSEDEPPPNTDQEA